jgi:integrase
MASVVHKPGSKYWHAAYRDHTGRQRRKSTKVTTRSKALEIARRWEKIAQRKLEVVQVRQQTEELVREFYREEIPFVTAGTFIETWFRLKRPEIAQSTYESYRKSADKFLAFLGDAANKDIALVKKHQIAEFRNHLLEKVQPQTANLDLKLIKTLFRAAKKDGYVTESAAEDVDLIRRINVRVRRAFTVDELRQVIEIADPEWWSMTMFGLYTGQRLGDLARLTWGSVDLARDIITFSVRKTGRTVIIPIAPPLRMHIMTMKIGLPAESVHPRCSQRLRNRLSNEFTDLLARAGLRSSRRPHVKTGMGRDIARRPSELSFHSLRHTMASMLEQAAIPRATVQALTGHSSDRMSELYTHVGLEALVKATAALPAL